MQGKICSACPIYYIAIYLERWMINPSRTILCIYRWTALRISVWLCLEHYTTCFSKATHSVKPADGRDHAAVWGHAAAADPIFMAREHLHLFTCNTQKKKILLNWMKQTTNATQDDINDVERDSNVCRSEHLFASTSSNRTDGLFSWSARWQNTEAKW